MKDLRLISFLPSATEMVCALGLEEQLIGVTHECDFPPLVRSKPVVVQSALALNKMSMREIDVAVSKCIGSGGSVYEVDEHLLSGSLPPIFSPRLFARFVRPPAMKSPAP